ncbi:helix-turn-helix domain-containing protein [Arthrobacter sp. ISL-85]|uniref:helix-turn-helix domain-containing protein n=1 Tax=Arthrobacter sp. ISL-85 TaxID=2819115 RepID=UPI001BEA7023|nr:helix-turn-helix domain-containing protein [Arthrobacter sp. ISL-85]MBT2568841.1 helix-turn-helix domain-containing protein [Arthrobacter sp. ISL-85]
MQNKVRDFRIAAGMSRGELAAALEVSRQTIQSIEVGRYLPSLPLAIAMARYFRRPVEEIFDPGWARPPSLTADASGRPGHAGKKAGMGSERGVAGEARGVARVGSSTPAVAEIFKAVAHPVRAQILELVCGGGSSLSQLCEAT